VKCLICWRLGEENSTRRRRGRTLGSEEDLRRLEEDLSTLADSKEQLDAEAKRWTAERDKRNEAVKALRAQVQEYRDKRDAANLRVQELKSEVLSLRGEVNEKRGKLQALLQRLGEARQGLTGDRGRLERRLRQLDWEVMTTPTREMLEREDQVVKEVRELRVQLEAFDLAEGLEAERLELRAAIMAGQLRLRGLREEMGRLSSESQVNHEKMVEVFKRLDEARGKADEAHRRVLEVRGQLRRIGGEDLSLRRRLQRLRAELRRGRVDRLRVEALQRIREKLHRGEKLSFEEFKLLSEAEE
jgi:uncharacterized coiled-coil DUF342 family protein